MKKEWERFPSLIHLKDQPQLREEMEARRRHRMVRYLLFRLQNQVEKGEPLEVVSGLPPGFTEFWVGEKPRYLMRPTLNGLVPTNVPANMDRFVGDLGGYASFAKVWDVDPELYVYIRHRSVWHEWNTKLMQIVPVLGEE